MESWTLLQTAEFNVVSRRAWSGYADLRKDSYHDDSESAKVLADASTPAS